jgi:hypothetical protein
LAASFMPVRPVSSRYKASDYYMNYYTRRPIEANGHVTHVIENLRVHSKLEAVIAAARLGLIKF